MNSIKPIKRVPAYQQAEEALKGMILGGELLPGDMLPTEMDLAEQLGV